MTKIIFTAILITFFFSSCKKKDEKPEMVVDFTFSTGPYYAPDYIRFTNLSSGANSFLWDFNDGSPIVSQQPSSPSFEHLFNQIGTYHVRLIAKDPDGVEKSVSKDVVVIQAPVLIVDFNPTKLIVAIGESDTFQNLTQGGFSQTGTFGPYLWNFGDGTYSHDASPVHLYTTAGTYQVNLEAQGYNGYANLTKSIQVVNDPFYMLNLMSIQDLRNSLNGSVITLPSGNKITGEVISDNVNGNIASNKNLYIWDGQYGVLVRFRQNHPYHLGEKVTIDISNAILRDYFGNVELDSIPLANSRYDGPGVPYPPRICSIAQLTSNLSSWNCSLVQVNNAIISGSSTTYQGNQSVSDFSGNVVLYTAASASFANSAYPLTSISITSVLVSYSGSPQLQMRNANDVH